MANNKVEIEITAKSTGFAAEFDKIAASAKDAGSKIRSALTGLQGAGAALGATLTVGGFALFIKSAIDAADKLNDLSKATGVSATSLGGIGFAAQQAGGDLEGAAKAFGKLNLFIADAKAGNTKALDTFKKLGISIADLKNLNSEEIFAKVADAFSQYADDANKAAGANLIFGKSYQSIVPLLDEGGDALRKNVDYFKKYSGVTDDLIEKSDQFNDSLVKLNLLNKAFGNYLAAALLPSLQGLADYLVNAKEKSTAFADTASGIVEPLKTLAKFGLVAGVAFYNLGTLIGGAAAALVALGGGELSRAKSIIADIGNELEANQKRVLGIMKAIDSPGGVAGGFVGPPVPKTPKRATPGFGDDGGAGKARADEFARALQNIAKAAAEADLELAAMFSTQEITGAQKALAALVASDAWKQFTQPQKDDLTARYQAIDAVQRETIEWKKKREEQEKSIKVLQELEQQQQHAIQAFTASLGQYADENGVLERQIQLVGADDLARAKLAETIKYEALAKQALLADDKAGLEILEEQFKKRIALIEQLAAATERFAQIQQYNAVFVNAFADGLTDIVTGTKSVKEAFKDMERSIVQSISRIAAQNLAEALFGTKSSGGGIGGILAELFNGSGSAGGGGGFDFSKILQSIISMFFGGGSSGFGSGPYQFAGGGFPTPGKWALVGEHGPELIRPKGATQVIANDMLGGGRRITNIYNVNVMPGASSASVRQTGDMLRNVVARSARSH